MPKHVCSAVALLLLCLLSLPSTAQDSASLYELHSSTDRMVSTLTKRALRIEAKIVKSTNRVLKRLERSEKKLKSKIARRNSQFAEDVFGDISAVYGSFAKKLQFDSSNGTATKYIGLQDSVRTALAFLNLQTPFASNKKIETSLMHKQYASLENTVGGTEQVSAILGARQSSLRNHLENHNLGQRFIKLQREVYYYRAQLDEYRNLWNNPSHIEAQVLDIVRNVPAFKSYFSKFSQLGQLFPPPVDARIEGGMISGIQSRLSMQALMHDRFGKTFDVSKTVSQALDNAGSELNQFRAKVDQLGSNNSDLELPDFKPNKFKTKSFLNRLELGTDIQSQSGNSILPVSTEVALMLGYKIHNKASAGIGGAYRLGWGRDIRHIQLSHEGFGIRSFVELQVKGNLWVRGGAELNYRATFNRLDILKDFRSWQKSALVGFTKKTSIKGKSANVQLLFDALYHHQIPRTNPIQFRIGYKLF